MNSSRLIYDEKLMNKVIRRLYQRNVTYGLISDLIRYTGQIYNKVREYTVKDLSKFVDENSEYIPMYLQDKISEIYVDANPNQYAFPSARGKNANRPLSKRTIEGALFAVGNEFGIDSLGVKVFERAFFFSNLRKSNFNFSEFKRKYKGRLGQFDTMTDLLNFYEISMEELAQENNFEDKINQSIGRIERCEGYLSVAKQNLLARNYSNIDDIIQILVTLEELEMYL